MPQQPVAEILRRLEALYDPAAVAGMARFGIRGPSVYGVNMPTLRAMARELGRSQLLAEELWKVPNRETRILATLIADPDAMSPHLMDRWARDFDCWEICDQCCSNLFARSPSAREIALGWSGPEQPELVRRAAFVIVARLAVMQKRAPDRVFEEFLPLLVRAAEDDRRNVQKALSWAVRQIGKRSPGLNARAVSASLEIRALDNPSARRTSSEVLRELRSDRVRQHLDRRRRKEQE